MDTFHEEICRFIIISFLVMLGLREVSEKITHFKSRFFPKIVAFIGNYKKYSRVKEAKDVTVCTYIL